MKNNKVVLGSVTIIDITDTTAVASDVAQGKYFYTADGEKTLGTAEGGITPTGTISITENGSYNVTNFASASVSVSAGSPTVTSLWTNPNPSTSFVGQTININVSAKNFDVLDIEVRSQTTSSSYNHGSILLINPSTLERASSKVICLYSGSSQSKRLMQATNLTSSSGFSVTFNPAKPIDSTQTANTTVIPTQIFGIKY